jgi:hypothetical protein
MVVQGIIELRGKILWKLLNQVVIFSTFKLLEKEIGNVGTDNQLNNDPLYNEVYYVYSGANQSQ